MNSNVFMRHSTECGVLASEIRPIPGDADYADLRNLAVYHLRAAAQALQKVAEAMAEERALTQQPAGAQP